MSQTMLKPSRRGWILERSSCPQTTGTSATSKFKRRAKKRLANSLRVPIFPPRANGDIGARGNGGKKLLRLSNGSREIGISEQKQITARLNHSVTDRVTFAAISRILQQAHGGMLARIT